MKLPNADRAFVDIAKLRDYCLSSTHPVGKHKAKVFASALGLTNSDADLLQTILLQTASSSEEALATELDEYGQRYVLDFDMTTALGSARIRSAWIVLSDEDFPRLVTCYII
jgi:hypothetical protein